MCGNQIDIEKVANMKTQKSKQITRNDRQWLPSLTLTTICI
jgi:hypothetical protein